MTDDDPRLPPHNTAAERSVLGSMLRENSCIGDVLVLLTAQDFYHDHHRLIFAAIADVSRNGAAPVDLVLLAEELIRRGRLEDAGRAVYLAELWDAAPTAANVLHYAGVVRDRSVLRRLATAATEILRDAYDPPDCAESVLEAAERRILDVSDVGVGGDTVTLGGAIADSFKRLDRKMRGDVVAVPTGFVDLDRLTGGLHDGELTLIAARPSVGKTALGLTIARHAVTREGLPVFFASLEQTRTQLADRLLCSQGAVDGLRLRKGKTLTDTELDALASASDELQRGALLHIDDRSNQTMTRIAANARRLKARCGIRLVVIDYAQIIEPENRKESRVEQLETISRRLKQLAKELAIPVVALAQLNRESENRPNSRPKMSDLKGSGSFEQEADVLMLLHKSGDHGTTDTIEVIVAKQREGPQGVVTLAYSKPFLRFENYAFGDDNPYAEGA